MANSQYRAAMRRRIIAKALDKLLKDDEQGVADVNTPACDGRHHRGHEHDYWRTCSAMSLGYERREYRGRHA